MIVTGVIILILMVVSAFVLLMLLNIKLGLFVFFVTLPFQNIYFPTPFMFLSLSDIFAALIFISWLALALAGKVELPKAKPLIFPIIFWILSLIGCLTSIEPVTSFRFTLRLISYFAIYIVLLSIFSNLRTIRLVLYAMAIQLLIISAVTNYRYLMSDIKIEDIADVDEEFEHGKIRQGGVVQNMNATAYNLTMLMPLVLALGLIEKQKFILFILPVALAALLITMSRGGWIAFALSLFFLPRLKTKQILVIVIGSVMVFSLFYVLFIGRIEATNLESESISIRFLMYKFGWNLFKEHPILGIGIGNFTINAYSVFPAMREELPLEIGYCSPHNQYLGLLAENGVIAFIFYICFLLFTSKQSKINVVDNNTFKILRKCAQSSFIIVLVAQMFTYFGLRNYLYWSIIALIYCLHDIASKASKNERINDALESPIDSSVAVSMEGID